MLYFELLDRIEQLDAQEVRALEDYLAARTPTPEADAARALLHLRLGDASTAKQFAQRAASAPAIETVGSYTLALHAAHQREWDRALELLAALPGDFPLAAEGRALRAAILLTVDRVGEARTLCEDVPGASDATRGSLAAVAAQCALAERDAEGARVAVAQALRFTPDIAWLRAARRGFGVRPGAIATVSP